jgi:hypothetical protein
VQHAVGQNLSLIGSKETYTEEYTPYFLQAGARVLLIVREPRDVLTSLNHGRGSQFSGRPKPHLFNIRQWRKSAAFIASYGRHPSFMTVRYEDLILDPMRVFEGITDWLGLDPLPQRVWEEDLRDQAGEVWGSNSSHTATSRITASSVGTFREFLAPEVDQLVQATCFPELHYLAYPTNIDAAEVPAILQRYTDKTPLERPTLASYQWSTDRLTEEMARWTALSKTEFVPALFIFPKAFSALRSALPEVNAS